MIEKLSLKYNISILVCKNISIESHECKYFLLELTILFFLPEFLPLAEIKQHKSVNVCTVLQEAYTILYNVEICLYIGPNV